MKHNLLLVVLLCICSISSFSQEVCENPKDEVEDLNSITKCTIKSSKNAKGKKSRQITVKVSAKKRFLKKRSTINKLSSTGLGEINTAGLNAIDTKSNLSEKATIAQANDTKSNLKNNIESLEEKLSKEEVRKASRFSDVDKIPSFPSCTSAKSKDKMECFNTEMVKHIQEHFRYPSEGVRRQIEGEVWVRFIIDKDGFVKNIKTLGPKNGIVLNEEAKRVVSKLPNFKPARKNGRSVSVKYGFPIQFSLQE